MAESDVQAFIQKALEAQQEKLEAAFKREITAIPDLLISRLVEEQKKSGRSPGLQSRSDDGFSGNDMISVMLMGDAGNELKITPSGVGIMANQTPEVKEGVGGDMIDVDQEEQDNIQGEAALNPQSGVPTISHSLSLTVPFKGTMEWSVELPKDGLKGWCKRLMTRDGFESFVEGHIFQAVSSMAILANTIYMGHEASTKMHNEIARLHNEDVEFLSDAPEYVFTMFFVCELLMRVVAQRLAFFIGRDVYWNFFDTVLIGISFFQMTANTGSNLSVFRIFRIFRLARLLKVIRRVEVLESLNLMVCGVVSCVDPLFWALLLLILIMYAFGVFFVSVAVTYLQDISVSKFDADMVVQLQVDQLDLKFGNIYKAVTCLFEGVSGGNDWANLAQELKDIGEAYYLCFALYIVFVTLGVLNIVTGFFVDGTMQASMSTREELVHLAQQKKTEKIQLIQELFEQLDTDQSGMLSRQELEASMNNDALLEYFCVLEIEPADAMELFNLLDLRQCKGEVSIQDFTQGCMRVVGNPKNLDIYALLTQGQKIIHLLESGCWRPKDSAAEAGALLLV